MFYKELIDSLTKDNSQATRLSKIVSPFSPYYICDHFIGDEVRKYAIEIPQGTNDLLQSQNLSLIKDFDLLHVQVDYFAEFCNKALDRIERKFILLTGQWHLPQLKISELTEKVLHHPNVILWASQNPIYQTTNTYLPFPYGIEHSSLESYSHALLRPPSNKRRKVANLPLNNHTNVCRQMLPALERISLSDFYTNVAESEFLMSPIGDRDDCYRHYEAIGLGTIPISNVSDLYKSIFGNSMYYCDTDAMLSIGSADWIDCEYVEPNRNIICLDYHKQKLNDTCRLLMKSA